MFGPSERFCRTPNLPGVLDASTPTLWHSEKLLLFAYEFVRDGHRVKRYRPRIEGLFARVERWTCVESGKVHWRSLSKDNTLTVYGFDAGSLIADPENPHHVFSWLICHSYDDKGNAILSESARPRPGTTVPPPPRCL
jgi:hypothetical protein